MLIATSSNLVKKPWIVSWRYNRSREIKGRYIKQGEKNPVQTQSRGRVPLRDKQPWGNKGRYIKQGNAWKGCTPLQISKGNFYRRSKLIRFFIIKTRRSRYILVLFIIIHHMVFILILSCFYVFIWPKEVHLFYFAGR